MIKPDHERGIKRRWWRGAQHFAPTSRLTAPWSAEIEALNTRFVAGEITLAEQVRLGLLLADGHKHR